jgi:hypothetical protein
VESIFYIGWHLFCIHCPLVFFYWTSRIPAIDQAIFDSIFWFAIILSDYLSLFVVRRFLSVGGPIQSLFLGAIAGVLVVTTFFAVAILLTSLVIEMIYASRFSLSGYIHYGLPPIIEFLINNANQLSGRIMYPACLVHVWLLLFAVGAMGARLMNTMLHAIGYAQWLIRQGDQHPLRAVGLVAAIIVFIGVLTYDYVRDG